MKPAATLPPALKAAAKEQAREFLDLEAREASDLEDEEEEGEEEEEEEEEEEDLYVEEFASLQKVTPEKAEEVFATTATPIKVKRLQKKGVAAASASTSRRTNSSNKGKGARKRLNPEAVVIPIKAKKSKRKKVEEEEDEEEEEGEDVEDKVPESALKKERLQALVESRALVEAYKVRDLRQPDDPFLAEQVRQLTKLMEGRPKSKAKGEYLNKCALQVVSEDRALMASLRAEEEEQRLQPVSSSSSSPSLSPPQQHSSRQHGQQERQEGLAGSQRQGQGQERRQERKQLQEVSQRQEEEGLLPLPKALQKVSRGRPELKQVSVPVEVGEGFVVYLAKKTWNVEGSSPRSTQCLVMERQYTDRGGGSKSFSINVGLETALEIARVSPILINELTQ